MQPLKNGSHPSSTEKPLPALETIGGFVFKRMGPSQCCFRTVADCSLSVQEEPQNLIRALSRQLADLAAAVYREVRWIRTEGCPSWPACPCRDGGHWKIDKLKQGLLSNGACLFLIRLVMSLGRKTESFGGPVFLRSWCLLAGR